VDTLGKSVPNNLCAIPEGMNVLTRILVERPRAAIAGM
jgi:hypothetical protein